jgi:prepilin-type N-terminal cleavage/methylation domain-containing protein
MLQGEIGEDKLMKTLKKATMKGLTAIELLIVTSIIALIAVFATPMMTSVFYETELDKAVEITEDSVEKARRAARLYKTDVTMRIRADENLKQHSITITIPRTTQEQLLNDMQEVFLLPDSIRVVSGNMLIQFDSKGKVDFPAMVMMASNQGEFERTKMVIQ